MDTLSKLETIFGKRLNRYADFWEFQIFPYPNSFYLKIEPIACSYVVSIVEKQSVYDSEKFCHQTENKRICSVCSKESDLFQKVTEVLDLFQKDLQSKIDRISEINDLVSKL